MFWQAATLIHHVFQLHFSNNKFSSLMLSFPLFILYQKNLEFSLKENSKLYLTNGKIKPQPV